jgi:hypothetical protein
LLGVVAAAIADVGKTLCVVGMEIDCDSLAVFLDIRVDSSRNNSLSRIHGVVWGALKGIVVSKTFTRIAPLLRIVIAMKILLPL